MQLQHALLCGFDFSSMAVVEGHGNGTTLFSKHSWEVASKTLTSHFRFGDYFF
jgi:hypothetical protein